MKGDKLQDCQYRRPEDVMKEEDGGNICCRLSQLKFTLYLFNVLFFLSGVVLSGIGLWSFLDKHPSLIFLTSGFYDITSCILIFSGIIILVVAVCGFCGLSRENYTTILLYSILLAIIFIAELGAGSMAYLYKEVLSNELGANLKVIFLQRYGPHNKSTEAVDHLQTGLHCCGVNSFEDWRESVWWEERGDNLVPDSCCITPSEGCGRRDHPSNIRYTGCEDRVVHIAGDHLVIIGAAVLGISLIQLIGTIMACTLQCKLRKFYYHG